MLVLSRETNEKVVIGDDIVLTVTRVGRRQCWLGIEAPRNVSIDRKEVLDARAAAGAGGGP